MLYLANSHEASVRVFISTTDFRRAAIYNGWCRAYPSSKRSNVRFRSHFGSSNIAARAVGPQWQQW
eukprot:2443382-Lingulodinium_polyedra.AAC.1